MRQKDYDIDWASFYEEEKKAIDASNNLGDPSIINNFYKYNSEIKIDPDFIRAIFGVSDNISSPDVIIK